MAVSTHTMMIVLSDEDRELLQLFASEQGIDDLAHAVGPLLHEYMNAIDAIWDEKLSRPSAKLDALMAQVQADADAGLTEDLIFDDDDDL